MNREHWKSVLPFVQAFANGEDVQTELAGGRWYSVEDLCFSAPALRYRIAPKEKTGWINIYPEVHNTSIIHPTKEKADREAGRARIACIQITYKEGDGL